MKSTEISLGNPAEPLEKNPRPRLKPLAAVWRIVDILEASKIPTSRLIVEGIVYLAIKGEYQAQDHPIISAFDERFASTDNGLLETQEALASLREIGWLKRNTSSGYYMLGSSRYEDQFQRIRDASGEDETALILAMAKICYDTFYVSSR